LWWSAWNDTPSADQSNPLSIDNLLKKAVSMWLDENQFKSCLDSDKYKEKVSKDMEYWATKFGINWTPGIVAINTKNGKWSKPVRSYNELKTTIDAYLADTNPAVAWDTNVLNPEEIQQLINGYKKWSQTPSVVILEYSDVECPYCRSYVAEWTLYKLVSEYPELSVMFKHFPLSFHPNAQKAAESMECAWEQKGNDWFWEYHDLIFKD